MFLFNSKSAPMLGIDISSTAVKVVEVVKKGNQIRVESHAVEPLPADAVAEKVVQDVEAVGEAIRKAVKKSGSKTRQAAVAVPGSSVITKIIPMPAALGEEELEAQIQTEAEQYIPYPLEEINLDFEVQGPSEDAEDTVDVLLAASKSENVEMRSSAIALGGLSAKIMDVEPYTVEHVCRAVPQMLPDDGHNRTIAVIDVGATVTSLNVIHDLQLIYTREQPFGGKQLTEEIMRRYGLSYEDAGRVKKHGGLPDNYEPDVLEPFKSTMAQQVSRFLQFFFSSSDYEAVDQILLCGGCAGIDGIDEFIETHMDMPTAIGNPFQHLTLGSKVNRNRLIEDGPSMMIALGLALRGVD